MKYQYYYTNKTTVLMYVLMSIMQLLWTIQNEIYAFEYDCKITM